MFQRFGCSEQLIVRGGKGIRGDLGEGPTICPSGPPSLWGSKWRSQEASGVLAQ